MFTLLSLTIILIQIGGIYHFQSYIGVEQNSKLLKNTKGIV